MDQQNQQSSAAINQDASDQTAFVSRAPGAVFTPSRAAPADYPVAATATIALASQTSAAAPAENSTYADYMERLVSNF